MITEKKTNIKKILNALKNHFFVKGEGIEVLATSVDPYPISGSQGLVTSGGVYAMLSQSTSATTYVDLTNITFGTFAKNELKSVDISTYLSSAEYNAMLTKLLSGGRVVIKLSTVLASIETGETNNVTWTVDCHVGGNNGNTVCGSSSFCADVDEYDVTEEIKINIKDESTARKIYISYVITDLSE